MKSSIGLALCFGLALTAPAMALYGGTLSEHDADLVLERLTGNVDLVQAGGKEAMALFDELLDPVESHSIYALGKVDGFDAVSWHQDYSGHYQAVFSFVFPDRAAVERFRNGLDAVAGGPSDPACRNETTSNWATQSNRSILFRSWDYGEDSGSVPAELVIHGAPPQDANCNPTSGSHDDLLDAAAIGDMIDRLIAEPPSFSSADAIALWTKPYGQPDIPLASDCDALAYFQDPIGLAGVSMLIIAMPYCEGASGRGAYIQIVSSGYDMFAGQTITAAVEERLGTDGACIQPSISYYALSKNRTLATTNASDIASLTVHDMPIETYGCP